MRVRLRCRRAKRTDSFGAVALIVAALAVAMLMLAAFTTDLGMAYVSKRQLQTSADAGALAAAATYADKSGSCSTLAGDAGLKAAAQAASDAKVAENRRGATAGAIDVGCSPDGRTVQVTTLAGGTTPRIFSSLTGAGDQITTSRRATASISVPDQVLSGVRPYMVCTSSVATGVLPSAVVRVDFPGAANNPVGCPDGGLNGNWWTVDCPEDGSNSTADLTENTLNGCEGPVGIVPGQPAVGSPALDDHLVAQCHVRSTTCLSANTGNLSSAGVASAWQTLTDQQKTIVLPVFCGTPACEAPAIYQTSGNNVVYPVHRMAAVIVCGYRWANNKSGSNLTGPCANNPGGYRVTGAGVANQDKFLLLVFTHVLTSGSVGTTTCTLGDASCDFGARRLQLTD